MKFLKKALLAFVVLVLILLVISLFLPSKYHVERSIVMRAKPDAIFPWFNNLKKWPEWSAWTREKDPTMTQTYLGSPEGVGAVTTWEGKTMGDGTMAITDSDPKTGIHYDLSFNLGKYKSKGTIRMEPSGDGTKLTWTDDGDLGNNPINRYFGLMMGKMIGPDFESGLSKLKQKVEQRAR